MVRGNPRNIREADLVLDELVRRTFIFLKDNPVHVAKRQPKQDRVKYEYDRELTDSLIKAELLSDGYAAVLSGTPTKVGDDFKGGAYWLVVYAIQGKNLWEREGDVNASLNIRLKNGTEPGIQNAVCEYKVDRPRTVTFEEANNLMEGWIGIFRQISVSKKTTLESVLPTSSVDKPDDFLAYQKGQDPLGPNGRPIPDNLFPGARVRFSNHPEGTRYIADDIGNIKCYFPKPK